MPSSAKADARFLWADGDIVFEDEDRAAYDPNQARVPAGHPDGGQWTDGGSEFLEPIGPQSKEYPYEDAKAWLTHISGGQYATIQELRAVHPTSSGSTVDAADVLKKQLEKQSDGEGGFKESVYGQAGYPNAQQLKRGVEQLIGIHLQQQFNEEELREMANLLGISVPTTEYDAMARRDVPLPAWTHQKYANAVAGRITAQWAVSSGDTHPWSVLMQDAIRQEFDLDDAVMDHLTEQAQEFGPISSAVDRAWSQLLLQPDPNSPYETENARQRSLITRVFRAHARAQYNETQLALERAGIDSVDLVRGAGLSRDDAFEIARTGVITLQPASSFSLSFSTARDFAGVRSSDRVNASTVIRSRVPRRRILSFPKTGFGCLNESELVVLGGKMKARIMYWLD